MLAGLDDAMLGNPDMEKTFGNNNTNLFTILISHAPDWRMKPGFTMSTSKLAAMPMVDKSNCLSSAPSLHRLTDKNIPRVCIRYRKILHYTSIAALEQHVCLIAFYPVQKLRYSH